MPEKVKREEVMSLNISLDPQSYKEFRKFISQDKKYEFHVTADRKRKNSIVLEITKRDKEDEGIYG